MRNRNKEDFEYPVFPFQNKPSNIWEFIRVVFLAIIVILALWRILVALYETGYDDGSHYADQTLQK